MTKIIATHSFRGGTGKSTITSNVALQLAKKGNKVIIVDLDLSSPGIHAMFGLDEDSFDTTFNGVMRDDEDPSDAVYDVSEIVGLPDDSLLLVPSVAEFQDLARALVDVYNHRKLMKAVKAIITDYRPDFLFIDTHPGINEEVLLTMNKAHAFMVVVRPDNQDYQGAKVSIDIAKKLNVPAYIVLNKVHKKARKNLDDQVGDVFEVPVLGTIPFSEDVLIAESSYIFSAEKPGHAVSKAIKSLAMGLLKKL